MDDNNNWYPLEEMPIESHNKLPKVAYTITCLYFWEVGNMFPRHRRPNRVFILGCWRTDKDILYIDFGLNSMIFAEACDNKWTYQIPVLEYVPTSLEQIKMNYANGLIKNGF